MELHLPLRDALLVRELADLPDEPALGLVRLRLRCLAVGWLAFNETLGLPDIAGMALVSIALVLAKSKG